MIQHRKAIGIKNLSGLLFKQLYKSHYHERWVKVSNFFVFSLKTAILFLERLAKLIMTDIFNPGWESFFVNFMATQGQRFPEVTGFEP